MRKDGALRGVKIAWGKNRGDLANGDLSDNHFRGNVELQASSW